MSIRPVSLAGSGGGNTTPNSFVVDCAINQYQDAETAWYFKVEIVRPSDLATAIISGNSYTDDSQFQVRDDRTTATDRDIAAVGGAGVTRSTTGKRADGTVGRIFYYLSAEELALLYVGETIYARFYQGYYDGEAVQWSDPLTNRFQV